MESSKPFYQSKTLWFNMLTLVSVLLAAPELQALFGADALRYVIAFQAAVNVVLRYAFTSQPIK